MTLDMDVKQEADLYKAIYLHRPAGIHKHMNMLSIASKVELPPSDIWQKIAEMYRLDKADALGPTIDVDIDFYGYMLRHFNSGLETRQLSEQDSEDDSEGEDVEQDVEQDESSEDSDGDKPEPRRSSRLARKPVPKKQAKTKTATPKAPAPLKKEPVKEPPTKKSLKRTEPEPSDDEEPGPRTRARQPPVKKKQAASTAAAATVKKRKR